MNFVLINIGSLKNGIHAGAYGMADCLGLRKPSQICQPSKLKQQPDLIPDLSCLTMDRQRIFYSRKCRCSLYIQISQASEVHFSIEVENKRCNNDPDLAITPIADS